MAFKTRSDPSFAGSRAELPFVTVVSGIPRSGTSLLMQMLEAGGMDVLVDGSRPADEDNPRGYYEYAPVLATSRDPSWIAAASGRAVKVIHALIRDLPLDRSYRVLLLRRNLQAVVRSQQALLDRRGVDSSDPHPAPERLAELFHADLRRLEDWLSRQPRVEWMPVSFEGVLTEPRAEAAAVNRFLGGGLSVESMASVVVPRQVSESRVLESGGK